MIGERLMCDGLSADLLREAPELMSKDLTKLKANVEIYQHLLAKENEQQSKVEFADLIKVPYFERSSFPKVNLKEKQCHLWYYGERNTGKTYMIE